MLMTLGPQYCNFSHTLKEKWDTLVTLLMREI